MGYFHCPIGASYYDDDACIDCGMCSAQTSAEKVDASLKIRAYFKERRPRPGRATKIAVCGKGGVGKSTVIALMATALSDAAYEVLVLDADESNPGFHRILGFPEEPRPLASILPAKNINDSNPGESWFHAEKISIRDIPKDVILVKDGVKLMETGKITDPFQGCGCAMAGIAGELIQKLTLDEGQIVLIDMEAGVENFGRGVERYSDTVVIIVEPSFESIALAEKIAYMAEGMGIAGVSAILNKVPTEEMKARLYEELARRKIEIAGTIYLDQELFMAGFEGKPVRNTAATTSIKPIINSILTSR